MTPSNPPLERSLAKSLLSLAHQEGSSSPPGIVAGPAQAAASMNDVELLQSMRNGCEKSFDELFARYWKLVFAIAWNITRHRSEAEDIVQDVFLTIYVRSSEYDAARASVRTWIAQFAHFKALVRRRSLQVSLANLDELKLEVVAQLGAVDDGRAADLARLRAVPALARDELDEGGVVRHSPVSFRN